MNASRRTFLKTASVVSAAGTLAPLGVSLWGTPSRAAGDDYRALVCVFLYGANDSGNMLIRTDASGFAAYQAARGPLALPLADLVYDDTRENPALTSTLSLNPGLAKVAGLYRNTGRVAVLANVGPLAEPTYRHPTDSARLVNDAGLDPLLPPKLRSHNDQQAWWQSFATEGNNPGWGGDLIDAFRAYAGLPEGPNDLFSAISVGGDAVFLKGRNTTAYQVSPTGPLAFNGLSRSLFGVPAGDAPAVLLPALTGARTGLFERVLNQLRQRSINATQTLKDLPLPELPPDAPAFTGPLGEQLKMVLRLIKAGKALGLRRQVFHVGLGGFDHHDGLLDPDTGQAALLRQVDEALFAFDATLQLAGTGVPSNEVTLFTASDFGRTTTPNTDGSDHGWGGHHLILGGAVNGGVYGTVPLADATDASWWSPRGTLIPSVSTQQYVFTLGRWFGLPPAVLEATIPHVTRFTGARWRRNLGFMTL